MTGRIRSTLIVAFATAAGSCTTGPVTYGPVEVPSEFNQPVHGSTQSMLMVGVAPGIETAPFWIGATEVPWDLYDVFVYRLDEPAGGATGADAVARPSKPYISMDRGFGHTGYPAISMSFRGAEAFCAWLSERTGRRYRLPTEREWRHVCSQAALERDDLKSSAWCRENSGGRTHPVGSKTPDAAGLHDLFGNAAEWCVGEDGRPVVLGGHYRDPAARLGCDMRLEPTSDWNDSDPQLPKSVWWLADAGFVGFRVVCETSNGKTNP